ncbi:MAG: hypothetical protein L6V81_11175 [Clostridium sp.]|nr:MAG: hypothetical protein L6V81_11175 [Clostridium sp.]
MENNEELVVNTDTTENVVEQATEEIVDGNNTTEDVTENQSPEEKNYILNLNLIRNLMR